MYLSVSLVILLGLHQLFTKGSKALMVNWKDLCNTFPRTFKKKNQQEGSVQTFDVHLKKAASPYKEAKTKTTAQICRGVCLCKQDKVYYCFEAPLLSERIGLH